MRVLMLSKALVSGTSQRKLEELARCPGVELTLVTPPYWQHDNGTKQTLEKLYTSGYRMIVTPMLLNGNYHLHSYPKLGGIMREVKPEIVHIDEEPYNFATFQAMRLAHRYKARALFFTWQNLYRDYPPPFRQMELYNYKYADAAIAGNREAVEVLRRKGYKKAAHVIPQFGFDTEIYKRSAPRAPRLPGAPFTLGFLGRLVETKGLLTIVEALTYLPDYCQAVFVGDGPIKGVLEAEAACLGVSERVIIKPGVPTYEAPRILEAFDVHVLPSRTFPNWKEQFGRTLAEAMACETPVIGSDSGEIPHVIGDAGLIFPEGNAQELAARVRQLLDAPELYATLAAKGRQRVLENYTQERIARQTFEVYQEMLAGEVKSAK
ncbi:MAG TPA: glycosyltransferase [Ktedonobacteraceae bacterium]|jgi:glycosyltransferase involved in cell wall biosynthesis|nr:glycosyltransferase [Ktedonobacteraceae bacterium]